MHGVGVSTARWAPADVNQLVQLAFAIGSALLGQGHLYDLLLCIFTGYNAFLFCITRLELFGLSDVILSELTFVIASGTPLGKQRRTQNLVAHIRKAHLDFRALL